MAELTTYAGDRPVRVVIAHESPFVRAGLRAALEDASMIVRACCADADTAELEVIAAAPDVLLVSVALPGGADTVIRRVRAAMPHVELLLIADDADAADTAEMIRFVTIGAHGILLGTTDPARLPFAIAGVLCGEAAFPRRVVRAMADELARRHRHSSLPITLAGALTVRETQVLASLADGEGVEEVARELGISPATVRRHAATATHKLGATGRAQALAMLRGEAPAAA